MKPLYWVLIAIGVLLVIFLIYNANQNKKKAAAAAAILAAQNQPQQQVNLPPNYSSTLAQIISSLYPFFGTYFGSSNQEIKP